MSSYQQQPHLQQQQLQQQQQQQPAPPPPQLVVYQQAPPPGPTPTGGTGGAGSPPFVYSLPQTVTQQQGQVQGPQQPPPPPAMAVQSQVPLSPDVIQSLLQVNLPRSGEPIYVQVQQPPAGLSTGVAPSTSIVPPPPPLPPPPPPTAPPSYSPGSSTTTAVGASSSITAPPIANAMTGAPAMPPPSPQQGPAIVSSASATGSASAGGNTDLSTPTNQTKSQKIHFDQSNVFISGLSWSLNDEGLRALFAPFGEMHSYRVLVDANTGRSKGVGFVHYKSQESALKAIEAMNGSIPADHTVPIKVKIAEEAAEFVPEVSNKLFVRNIPRSVVHGQFRGAFARFGEVMHVTIMPDTSTQGRREHSALNMGYVTFKTIQQATEATQTMHHRKDVFPGQEKLLEVKAAESLQVRNQRRIKDSTTTAPSSTTTTTTTTMTTTAQQSYAGVPSATTWTSPPAMTTPATGDAGLLPRLQAMTTATLPATHGSSQAPVVLFANQQTPPPPQSLPQQVPPAPTVVYQQQAPPVTTVPVQPPQQQQVIVLQPQLPPPQQ